MAKRKPPASRVLFFARIRPASEKLRRQLQRQLGGVGNADVVETAFEALAAKLATSAESQEAESSAA